MSKRQLSKETQAIVDRASNTARYLFNPLHNKADLAFLEGFTTPAEFLLVSDEAKELKLRNRYGLTSNAGPRLDGQTFEQFKALHS